jgi:hypothetical protein
VPANWQRREHRGILGSLNNGRALPDLSADELAVAINIEHATNGPVRTRRGHSTEGEAASVLEPYCAPTVDATTDPAGDLHPRKYYVRYTYATSAGETDDLKSTDIDGNLQNCPAETEVTLAVGENALLVSVPMHVRKALVATASTYRGDSDGGPITGDAGEGSDGSTDCLVGDPVPPDPGVEGVFPDFELEPYQEITVFTLDPADQPVGFCDDLVPLGWLVYSRSPQIQDETHLGTNCDAADPLYHRRGALGPIIEFDLATMTFMMEGAYAIGNSDHVDENTIDLMMPDRASLAILHANIYISQDGVRFYYAGQISDGRDTLLVTQFDDTATQAPSTRITRVQPVLEDVEPVEKILGVCPDVVAKTNVPGGVFGVWYTWNMEDESYMADPGLADFLEDVGWSSGKIEHRYPQESWPSCRSVIAVSDDRAIRVTPPDRPVGVPSWNLYTERLQPYKTGTFAESVRNPIQAGGGTAVAQNIAFYLGDNDRSNAQIEAAIANGEMEYAPLNKIASANYDEYDDESALVLSHTLMQDPFAPGPIPATVGYRPAYADITTGELDENTGDLLPLFASARPSISAGNHMFLFYLDADDASLTTHAIFELSARWRPNLTSYSPANKNNISIRVWDATNATWVNLISGPLLKREPYQVDDCWTFIQHRLAIEDVLHKAMSWSGLKYLVVDVKTTDKVGFDLRDVSMELYREPETQGCFPCHSTEEISTYGTQEFDFQDSYRQDMDPELTYFYDTALYSGKDSLSDAAVNAVVTEAAVLTGSPRDKWDTPDGYDEYEDISLFGAQDPALITSRGWPPAYEEIRPLQFEYGTRRLRDIYASSRDGSAASIANNEHLFWIWVGPPETWACGILKVRMRTRAGGASFNPADGAQRQIRYWDEGTSSWVVLQDNIPTTDDFRWYSIKFTPSITHLISEVQPGFGTAYWYVFDVAAIHHNGYDIDDIRLELYKAQPYGPLGQCDPVPSADCVLQRDNITEESCTLQNPHAERPFLVGEDVPDVGIQGEWQSLRPNTTAQWPVMLASFPIVGDEGVAAERMQDIVAIADCVFTLEADGKLTRIFQIEGEHWLRCLIQDWRSTSYLWRIFFCNTGEPRWNYRYDGVQTYPMGLPIPANTEDVVDISGNYVPPDPANGSDLPEIVPEHILEDIFHDPLGEITSTNMTTATEDDAGVTGWDAEWYIVYKRVVTGPNGYIVRSAPRLLTDTVRLRGTDDFSPSVTIEATICPEPQVTHLEVYRNMANTAKYFLVGEIAINQGLDRDANGAIDFFFEDMVPVSDEDLTVPMFRQTGRPTAATMMMFHRGRVFFIQQADRELIAFTNVTSASADLDPEGFYPLHVIDPPMRLASGVTCLSPYHAVLLAHSANGIVAVDGLSDESNDPQALSAVALLADIGAIGPDAWVNVDNIQFIMTKKGPAVVLGDEVKYIGFNVQGTVTESAELTTETAYNCRVLHYRKAGSAQLVFTFADNPNGHQFSAMVMDQEVGEGGEERAIWKVWNHLPIHGACITQDPGGADALLMGGSKGRIFRHDTCDTDAGLPIQVEIQTAAFAEGPPGSTFQPHEVYFQNAGEPSDGFMLDLRKDMDSRAVNSEPIPVLAGSSIRFSLDDENDPEWRAQWDEYSPGWDYPDIEWPEHERDYATRRVSLGGVMHRMQLRLYLGYDSWPVGAQRGMVLETTGFTVIFSTMGDRPASP